MANTASTVNPSFAQLLATGLQVGTIRFYFLAFGKVKLVEIPCRPTVATCTKRSFAPVIRARGLMWSIIVWSAGLFSKGMRMCPYMAAGSWVTKKAAEESHTTPSGWYSAERCPGAA